MRDLVSPEPSRVDQSSFLPTFVNGGQPKDDTDDYLSDLRTAMQAFERRYIAAVLTRAQGNKIEAAQLLGIGVSSLYRKMVRLELVEESASSTTTDG